MRDLETRIMTTLLITLAVADALFLIAIGPLFGLPSVPLVRGLANGGVHWQLASILMIATPLFAAYLTLRYLAFSFTRRERPFWFSRRPELLLTLAVIIAITWLLIALLLVNLNFAN